MKGQMESRNTANIAHDDGSQSHHASRQSERTKAHIRNTLMALLASRDIESISMKLLAEEARLNRSTIYQYYDSLLSVLGDCISRKAGNANNRIPDPDSDNYLAQIHIVVLDSCRGIKENLGLYQLVRRCGTKTGSARHVTVLQENALKFYQGVVDGLVRRDKTLEPYSCYLPELLSAVSGSISRQWVDSGCKEPPEHIADMTMNLFEGILSAFHSKKTAPHDPEESL